MHEALLKKGYDSQVLHLHETTTRIRCNESDVIIFYRCYSDQISFIQSLRMARKLVIYDIDDFVFQKPGQFNTMVEADLILRYVANVNCLTASTQTLLDQMPNTGIPRFVRTNAIDQETFDLMSSPLPPGKQTKKRFRIGWPSGINRTEMHDYMKNFLRLLEHKRFECEFWYFGVMDEFYKFVSSLKYVRAHRMGYVNTAKYKDLYQTFKMCSFDVVMNPLPEDDIFFHSKSHLKFIEWGAIGIPLLTSRVSPFKEFLTEGVLGYQASSMDEFYRKLYYIKNNPQEVEQVVKRAREYVKTHFMVEDQVGPFVNSCIKAMTSQEAVNRNKVMENAYVADINQDHFGYVTPEVLSPVTHEFKCRLPGLCRVEFLGSKLGRLIQAPLKLVITNKDTKQIIYSKIYNIRDLKDGHWWGFDFPPVPDSSDGLFEVSLIPQDRTPGMGIQLFFNYHDIPEKGFYFIDGEKQQGSLAFKSFCAKNYHSLPIERRETIPVMIESDEVKRDGVETPKILLKMKSTLSDVLLLMPITRALRTQRQAQVFLSTNHQAVFKDHPDVAGVIPYDAHMGNVHQRFLLDKPNEINPKVHPLIHYARVVLGHENFEKQLKFQERPIDRETVETILKRHRLEPFQFVVFHEGVVAKNRTWPQDKWTRLEAHCLAQGLNLVVVGFGSDFTPKMPSALNLVNLMTPHEIKAILDVATALVCVDGDVMAIAAATDVPIIPLLMATEADLRLPFRNDTLGWKCYPIVPNIDCAGCWHKQLNTANYFGCARKDYKCMDLITPKMVLDRINNL